MLSLFVLSRQDGLLFPAFILPGGGGEGSHPDHFPLIYHPVSHDNCRNYDISFFVILIKTVIPRNHFSISFQNAFFFLFPPFSFPLLCVIRILTE